MGQIPIPVPSPQQEKTIVDLVDTIIAGKKAGENTDALEKAVDEEVFKLYDLNDEEKELIKR